MSGKQGWRAEQSGKGTTPACFPIFLALFLTIPQTNKQTSVQAQRFNHCLMFLHSGIFCSCCLHFHLSLGPAQGSFRCPKGHDFWVLLFHISMQYVLAKFLDVEFLSKYTAPGGQESSPWMIATCHFTGSLTIHERDYVHIPGLFSFWDPGGRHLGYLTPPSFDECKWILII